MGGKMLKIMRIESGHTVSKCQTEAAPLVSENQSRLSVLIVLLFLVGCSQKEFFQREVVVQLGKPDTSQISGQQFIAAYMGIIQVGSAGSGITGHPLWELNGTEIWSSPTLWRDTCQIETDAYKLNVISRRFTTADSASLFIWGETK